MWITTIQNCYKIVIAYNYLIHLIYNVRSQIDNIVRLHIYIVQLVTTIAAIGRVQSLPTLVNNCRNWKTRIVLNYQYKI